MTVKDAELTVIRSALDTALDQVNEIACAFSQFGYTVEYETLDVSPIGKPSFPALRAKVYRIEELKGKLNDDDQN